MSIDNFKLLMISAGFEHGGNVTQRYLDGHEALYVYPFESQLGNRYVNDYMASLERHQYRYPVFPDNLSARELYELFYDEELKTMLRKPNGSKFKTADMEINEQDRIKHFEKALEGKPHTRANVVAAFFTSTFDAWKNYNRSGKNNIYVGYSPIIGIDSHRIVKDFPDAQIIHVVRNPYSAYSDTKKRPFPLPLRQYVHSWNLYHHIMLMHEKMFPDNIRIIRFEDLIADPEKTLTPTCKALGIEFSEAMTYPSWNGRDLTDNIYPWGTINKANTATNLAEIETLSDEEKSFIQKSSEHMLKVFNYDDLLKA